MNTETFNNIQDDTEEFRDHIATVDAEGKRIWLYPKKPSGRYYNARAWVSFAFLVIFLLLPFIKVDGEQFFLFDVIHRKFVIWGILFTPQDFHLFVLATLTFFVFIILFTVIFGRLFCGWVCPQTVFMEMIFRRIEYWIEGDYTQQRKLDSEPWSASKIRKKAIKHAMFFAIAVVVANYFLAYVIGMDEVLKIIVEPMSAHMVGFLAMLVFSGVFYMVFSRLREQVCTTICPYGRMQGVLLVKDTIVVGYDFNRGEPRGKLKKNQPIPALQGDCIDCKLCIAVCPTGIDIRNGTQLECTNCTACMDACDPVMDKIGKPRGLIRYDSMTGIESGIRKIFTVRVIAYSLFLTALLVLDVVLIANRGLIETIILRAPGQMPRETEDHHHESNLYTYVIINKSAKVIPVELRTATPGAVIRFIGKAPETVEKGTKAEGTFFVDIDEAHIAGRKTPLVFQVYSEGKKIDEVKTNFPGFAIDHNEDHSEHKSEEPHQ
jgi:cytochrome c oxidase accessory protein FixG